LQNYYLNTRSNLKYCLFVSLGYMYYKLIIFLIEQISGREQRVKY